VEAGGGFGGGPIFGGCRAHRETERAAQGES
jgi:hypothetical protein